MVKPVSAERLDAALARAATNNILGLDDDVTDLHGVTTECVNDKSHFDKHIDWQNSVHRAQYEKQLARLRTPGPAAPFTLPAEAVLAKVVHALESRRPRARYPVTVPAVAFWWLRRLLSTRAMDAVLLRASGGGKR